MDNLLLLESAVIEVNDLGELKKLFGWVEDPILNDETFFEFANQLDLNQRRIRDAQAIGATVRNTNPSICLDIGTAEGHSAALMAVNAPQAQIYTINIPPEEIISGEGGVLTTIAMERERIGSYYRSKRLTNIAQILANTSKWEPDIGSIDVAFVDGCHDTEFIFNDTKKALSCARSGAFILWHDFNLELWNKYNWIHEVCQGVEMLLEQGLITGNIFHLRDSWVGIYRVP
jgi:predicted O-methyltransferase YrrM